jgi:hypothetical protein
VFFIADDNMDLPCWWKRLPLALRYALHVANECSAKGGDRRRPNVFDRPRENHILIAKATEEQLTVTYYLDGAAVLIVFPSHLSHGHDTLVY